MDMSVNIAGVEWKNPVTVASGTFGSGEEFSEYVDLNRLGAVTTKGVANVPWSGNPTPRVAEVYGGMMNAIGLQNPGIDLFCKRDIPFLKQYDTKIIVNVCGHAPEEYLAVVERLADEPIDMMEINISCPNVNAGFLAFGQDAHHVEELTGQIKKIAKQPVIMKLTPNVTDITEIAKAAEAGGADAVSLINTLTGMKIDINRKTFALANKTGGVSGPIVKPIAVRMVYQVAQAVNIPIIGMGGISCAEDAIEFLLAGASAVSVGTANFHNPAVTMEVIDGIEDYMKEHIPADHPFAGKSFRQGDIVDTIITCAGGETITLTLDTTLPRPYYSREFELRGTRGGCIEINRDRATWYLAGMPEGTYDNEAEFFEKYDHPLHREYVAAGERGGHGGKDYLVVRAFIEAVKNQTDTPIDVYDTLAWLAVGPLSAQSIALGGAPVLFPDFTHGKWERPAAPHTGKYSLDVVTEDPDTPILMD